MSDKENPEAKLNYQHSLNVGDTLIIHVVFSDFWELPPGGSLEKLFLECKKCTALHGVIRSTLSTRKAQDWNNLINAWCSLYTQEALIQTKKPEYTTGNMIRCPLIMKKMLQETE